MGSSGHEQAALLQRLSDGPVAAGLVAELKNGSQGIPPQRGTGVYDATRISVGQEKDPKNEDIGRWLIDAGEEGSASYGEDEGARGDEEGKTNNENVKMPQIRDGKESVEY